MSRTESKEMYLKTIYLLSKKKGSVRNIDIAAELNISKPSVTGMLKKLVADGDIAITNDYLVSLTTEGRERAEMIYNRYVTFVDLLTLMNIPEDKIRDAACKLEHGVSDEIFYYMRNWVNDFKKNK
ncbi:MAG: metal-dependent transcriptional regulator [Clostridia bacterium]|nr:metal-dependent transcriptional regulator [Clostridia bacterium]